MVDDAPAYVLRLFISGNSPLSRRAVQNIREICDQELRGKVDITVVDVLEDPQQAEDARVLATPTLIRELPPPLRRIIGDLTDHGVVRAALSTSQ